MISTILRINWLLLKRDRVAQVITLIVPIFFFSIFALIFGGQGKDQAAQVKVVVVDEAQNEISRRLTEALEMDHALIVQRKFEDGALLDREAAREMVASGSISVALVIPEGFRLSNMMPALPGAPRSQAGMTPAALQAGDAGEAPAVILFSDVSDPVAPKMVVGLLQAASFRAMPDLLAREGIALFERFGGPLTEQQQQLMDQIPHGSAAPHEAGGNTPQANSGAIPVDVVDVVGENRKSPAIAFYAASTGVMFLLFTISAAAGTLIDEEQMGVLERLLSSDLTMGQLLFGKWLYLSLRGMVQVSLMFIWGSLVFGLDLWSPGHLLGFVVMTTFTAVSASAFGLTLASACRTRAQLGGISTILVLSMSVVGGSMFPRYLMPDWMQAVGLITFNAWALDGYQKVFWYDRPLFELWPQLTVLAGVTIVCMSLARWWARRWEVI